MTSFPDGILVDSARRLVETFVFSPKEFSVDVTVRIYEVHKPARREMAFEFETSHYAHTPTQAGPYITSRPFESSVDAALHRAVTGITNYLEGAVKEGHLPSDSWLSKNEFFT